MSQILSQIEQGTVVTYRTGQALLAEFEASGAEQAFEEIVRLYAGMVYSVCQQVTKNAHDAEDAAQATFLALATQVKLGKKVKCLGPWLRQVAKRTSLDLCKSRKRREKREENHGRFSGNDRFNGNAGEANLESQDYKQALHDELNKLPSRYRLPLVMHYFGGLPPEQTALELNCKPKTLAVRLHRGRKMLAAQLSRRGIFVGGEMLGIASAPLMLQMMGSDVIHSTAHAAVGLTSGQDITALISTRVMSLMNISAKTAIFAKMKFLGIIVVLASTMLAGGAQAMRAIAPQMLEELHLPSIKLDITRWLRPMLRSAFSPNKTMVAQATSSNGASSGRNSAAAAGSNIRTVTLLGPAPVAPARGSIVFASYDSLTASDRQPRTRSSAIDGMLTLSESAANSSDVIRFADVNDGSVQLRLAATTLPSRPTLALAMNDSSVLTLVDRSGTLSDGTSIQPRTANAPMTPTPEPVGLAAALAGASCLLRRRPPAKPDPK